MSTLVIDASVAIKWVVEEQGTQEALALRRHRLTAPDLLVAECANILWKKVRRGELSAQEASLAARLLERADIDLAPTRRLLERATRLAATLDHPAYDCLYLVLAEASGCDMVTADARLCAKAPPTRCPPESCAWTVRPTRCGTEIHPDPCPRPRAGRPTSLTEILLPAESFISGNV